MDDIIYTPPAIHNVYYMLFMDDNRAWVNTVNSFMESSLWTDIVQLKWRRSNEMSFVARINFEKKCNVHWNYMSHDTNLFCSKV